MQMGSRREELEERELNLTRKDGWGGGAVQKFWHDCQNPKYDSNCALKMETAMIICHDFCRGLMKLREFIDLARIISYGTFFKTSIRAQAREVSML